MLYTFLTGKPPFDTDGIRNTLNKVVLAEFEMPMYLTSEAQDLIRSLLKKNPQERIYLNDVVVHPFMTKTNLKNSSFKPIVSVLHLTSGQFWFWIVG
jgi:polo-like kinase 4